MSPPRTAREALIAEVLGDVGKLLDRLDGTSAQMTATSKTLTQANEGIRDELADFERRMVAFTDALKVQVVRYMAVKSDEATRRTIDQQSRLMTDAARVAFAAELGPTVQRLQASLRPLQEKRERRWEQWVKYAAAAAAGSAATVLLLLCFVPR